MIHVERGEAHKAPGFDERALRWRDKFKRATLEDPKLSATLFWKSMSKEIRDDKDALRRIFRGKCAFCEATIEHVSRAQVEHYRPKGRFPERMFDWDNWLFSCGRCNESKWAHFPMCGQEPCLIDPTEAGVNPGEHLTFFHALVVPLSDRGEVTIRLLGLGRSPLEDERSAWLTRIDSLLLLATQGAPETRQEARDLLVASIQPEMRFCACTREYLKKLAPKLLNALAPRMEDVVGRMRELVSNNAEAIAILC